MTDSRVGATFRNRGQVRRGSARPRPPIPSVLAGPGRCTNVTLAGKTVPSDETMVHRLVRPDRLARSESDDHLTAVVTATRRDDGVTAGPRTLPICRVETIRQ